MQRFMRMYSWKWVQITEPLCFCCCCVVALCNTKTPEIGINSQFTHIPFFQAILPPKSPQNSCLGREKRNVQWLHCRGGYRSFSSRRVGKESKGNSGKEGTAKSLSLFFGMFGQNQRFILVMYTEEMSSLKNMTVQSISKVLSLSKKSVCSSAVYIQEISPGSNSMDHNHRRCDVWWIRGVAWREDHIC